MSNHGYATFTRRLLVIVGLLGVLPLCACAVFGLDKWLALALWGETHSAIGNFCKGAGNFSASLGVWFVVRHRLFTTVAGWLRAIAYLAAAGYGIMCFNTLSDSLLAQEVHADEYTVMRIPGARLADYGPVVSFTFEALTLAWAFWPLLFVFRRRLSDTRIPAATIPRLNVRFLLGWTALAAVLLALLRIIMKYGGPLDLWVTHVPRQTVFQRYEANLPLKVVDVLSIGLMMIAFSGGARRCLWAVPLAGAFRLGSQLSVAWLTEWLGWPRMFGIDFEPFHDWLLPYFAGDLLIAILVFTVASITGLRFQSAQT